MNKREIIQRLAERKAVERIVGAILRQPLPLHGDAADLSQIVYLTLLEKPDGWIRELAEEQAPGSLERYIAGIVLQQRNSRRSTYHRQIRRFAQASRGLTENDTNTEKNVWERHG